MGNAIRIFALVMLGGVFVMEGYDINAMALAVPRLEGSLGLSPTSFGWVFTALLLGLGIGGATLAPFGDRFGRRALIVSGCAATGVFTLATSTADTITEFLIWRGLTGIALGAALPNVSALSAELAPDKWRATIMAVVSAGIPLGLAIAGVMAPFVIDAAGWQGLFLVPGGFALLLALILRFALPGGLPITGGKPAKAGAVPQAEVFTLPWAIPFAVFCTMLALNALNLYLLNSWVPTVLPQAGFSLDDAAQISGVVQFAGLGIGVLVSLGIDRWNRAWPLVLMFAAMAICFLVVSLTPPTPTLWITLLCVGVGGASAGGMALPALCVYLFAPRLLSTAIGLGVLVARIGAFMGPLLGQVLLDADAGPHAFFFAAAVPAALCAIAALLIPMALKVRQRDDEPEAAVAAG